jgi:hypothetical protein
VSVVAKSNRGVSIPGDWIKRCASRAGTLGVASLMEKVRTWDAKLLHWRNGKLEAVLSRDTL